jgi:hypothetical protein
MTADYRSIRTPSMASYDTDAGTITLSASYAWPSRLATRQTCFWTSWLRVLTARALREAHTRPSTSPPARSRHRSTWLEFPDALDTVPYTAGEGAMVPVGSDLQEPGPNFTHSCSHADSSAIFLAIESNASMVAGFAT